MTQIWNSTIRDSFLWVYTLLLLTFRHNWAGHRGGRCCWSLPTHSEWALGTFLEAELRGKSMRALVERVERGRKRERIRWLVQLSYYYYYELLTSDLVWWGHWAPLSLVLFMLCLTEAPLSMSFSLAVRASASPPTISVRPREARPLTQGHPGNSRWCYAQGHTQVSRHPGQSPVLALSVLEALLQKGAVRSPREDTGHTSVTWVRFTGFPPRHRDWWGILLTLPAFLVHMCRGYTSTVSLKSPQQGALRPQMVASYLESLPAPEEWHSGQSGEAVLLPFHQQRAVAALLSAASRILDCERKFSTPALSS